MKNKPKISIITPSFNQGFFIEDTILSVKRQDYGDIEHIVMDAGSTDDTLPILKRYDSSYNLKWVSAPDNGQSDAINKGLERANGDIIGWLNSDDVYIYTDTIAHIVKYFESNPNVDIAFGDMAFIDKMGEVQTFYVHQKFDHLKIINGRSTLGQPAVFFRKKVLQDNKLRVDLHFAMDFELWVRLGGKYKFGHILEPVACPRIYPETKTGLQVGSTSNSMFSQERANILHKFGKQEMVGPWTRVYDKLSRGGMSRIKGLIYLLKNKYLFPKNFAFNGRYKKFPHDIIQQMFSNPLLKYLR